MAYTYIKFFNSLLNSTIEITYYNYCNKYSIVQIDPSNKINEWSFSQICPVRKELFAQSTFRRMGYIAGDMLEIIPDMRKRGYVIMQIQ
jgi:hypothetical protein